MLDHHDARTITANVDEVLDALRTNLAEHKEIVEEARVGYLDQAEKALAKRMTQLREGKLVALQFSLQPPQDHSREFQTVIKMLELHKNAHDRNISSAQVHKPNATIELKAADVQRFVLNDWSWMDSFLLSNSGYSGKSRTLAASKGLV